MAKYQSPGLLLPTAYESVDDFEQELQQRCEKAGFTAISDADLTHFGVKGMHWGVRKEQLKSDVIDSTKAKVSTTAHRVGKEYETGLVIAGAAALGLAYIHSPTAQKVMTVPVKATYHYLSVPNNRRKVGRVLKKSYVVYSKLH